MTDGNEQALRANQTLAHLLGFLTRLDESLHKDKVIESIKEKVKEYISNGVDDHFGTLFLPKTIEKSKELRSDIVKEEKEREYRHFTQSFDDDKLNETDYAKHLIDNIFPLFGCLYYMYYECSGDCSFIKGAKWKTEKCNGDQGQGKHLNHWLKDEKGVGRMIKRNFQQEDLGQKTGNVLFGDSGSSTNTLLYYDKGAHLQYCLYFMLFLPPPEKWDNAQSGHTVLFLETFCQMVKDGKFQDKYNDNGDSFKTACQKVEQNIKMLTGLNIIVPVSWDPTLSYENLLDWWSFWKYIEWLKKNIEQLIKSLKEMSTDVTNWNEAKLISSASYGPFPWGFTFYDGSWNNKAEQLNETLQNVITALQSLQSAMDKIKPIPPSNGSSIGSVIGGVGAAAATAGAAYAGSSVLGPVAEGVGKFVRGLFF